jgi:hypothetical protein
MTPIQRRIELFLTQAASFGVPVQYIVLTDAEHQALCAGIQPGSNVRQLRAGPLGVVQILVEGEEDDAT